MLNLISADVVAHGTKLHIYRTNSGKPPLVFVHGIADDGLCWMPVAEALADRYDVVLVDMRAHGKSEAPEEGYTLENMAAELADLIKCLGLKKPAIIGHSMGAITALILAGLFPDLPGSILLEDPPTFWNLEQDEERQMKFRQSLAAWMYGLKRKTKDDLLAEVKTQNPGWADTELEPWVNSKHRFSLKAVELIMPQGLSSLDIPNLIQRVSCPVLLIHADQSLGAISGQEDIARLKALLPQLQTTYITPAGHNIRREQFAQYLDIVQKNLSEFPLEWKGGK